MYLDTPSPDACLSAAVFVTTPLESASPPGEKWRLGYTAADMPGFTTDELASLLLVTPRKVRRWKEKQLLETKNRRISEKSLQNFLKRSPHLIDFDKLSVEAKVYLADLGYKNESTAELRRKATQILSGLGRD